MPRPRTPLPEDQTSFARRLQQWMWGQRPPFTNGQLAYHLSTLGHKVTTQAVWNWFNRRSIPDPSVFIQLERVTGIPLVEWYELAGYPVPSYERRSQPLPPLPTRDEDWATMERRAVEAVVAMEERKGSDIRTVERAVQETIAWIRDQQHGTNRVRHVEAEFHAPPDERVVDADQQPTMPIPISRPQQDQQQTPKPVHQERRAPRRREPAKPKAQS